MLNANYLIAPTQVVSKDGFGFPRRDVVTFTTVNFTSVIEKIKPANPANQENPNLA